MKTVVNVQQMRRFDEETIQSGVSSVILMQNVAKAILRAYPFSGKTAILCGKGNNGGDGLALSIELKKTGKKSDVFLVEEKFSSDGKYYYDKAIEEEINISVLKDNVDLSAYDTVVDCIFGTGFSGEPKDDYKKAIEAINKSKAFVLSVDINSGLNGNNGLCSVAVKSDLTCTVQAYKSGLFLNMAKDFVKKITVLDAGIRIKNTDLFVAEDTDFKYFVAPRKNFSHKGTYGYVGLCGGCENYSGALKLANLSLCALRAGCGVSTMIVTEKVAPIVERNALESTVCVLKDGYDEKGLIGATEKLSALAVGMGWGTDASHEKTLSYLIKNFKGNLLIDADGLNVLAKNVIELKERVGKTIVTPHLGEMSRLTGLSVSEIENDPVSACMNFAKEYGAIVLLKGPTSVVSDGEKTILVPRGCPGMATAGSGDVLSGILCGVLGRKDVDAFEATVFGAYLNGLAGELAQEEIGDISMLSSDTAKKIPEAIKTLRVATFGNSGKDDWDE